jgi:hypothetical protein
MRHHFRCPQAMFNKGSLFYNHCAQFFLGSQNWNSYSMILKVDKRILVTAVSCFSVFQKGIFPQQ